MCFVTEEAMRLGCKLEDDIWLVQWSPSAKQEANGTRGSATKCLEGL